MAEKQYLTGKQLAVIKRVVNRGDKEYAVRCAYDNKFSKEMLHYICGERSGPEGFSVSDGHIAILYPLSIPTLPKDSYLKESASLYRLFHEELEHGDYYLVDSTDEAFDIADANHLKTRLAEHRNLVAKCKKAHEPYAERCEATFKAKTNNGREIVGLFNARLVLDALEAVGKHPLCYIGLKRQNKSEFPHMLVTSRDAPWNFFGRGSCIGAAHHMHKRQNTRHRPGQTKPSLRKPLKGARFYRLRIPQEATVNTNCCPLLLSVSSMISAILLSGRFD